MNAINNKQYFFEIIDAFCDSSRSYFTGILCSKDYNTGRFCEVRLNYRTREYSWEGMEEEEW